MAAEKVAEYLTNSDPLEPLVGRRVSRQKRLLNTLQIQTWYNPHSLALASIAEKVAEYLTNSDRVPAGTPSAPAEQKRLLNTLQIQTKDLSQPGCQIPVQKRLLNILQIQTLAGSKILL